MTSARQHHSKIGTKFCYHLRNKISFSEGHGSMNAMGHVQSKCHVNFALDPLRSYFHDPQKNEIHLL